MESLYTWRTGRWGAFENPLSRRHVYQMQKGRTRSLVTMRALRVELRVRPKEVCGEIYGATVGVYLKDMGPFWVEIVTMARELMSATPYGRVQFHP